MKTNINNSNLVSIVEKTANILRDVDGLTMADAFDELIKVLYTQYVFDDTNESIVNFKKRYTEEVFDKKFFNTSSIAISDNSIKEILVLFDNIDFDAVDVKGRLFEIYLGRTFQGQLGQFFTPRNIVEFMGSYILQNVDSKEGLSVLDPSCGSGGMLTYLNNHIQAHFVGCEVDKRLIRVSNLNLTINNAKSFDVKEGNFLDRDFDQEFDVVISNPPFGIKEKQADILAKYELGTKKSSCETELLFVENVLRALKPNGVCGIVLPQGALNNVSTKKMRSLLLDNATLIASVDLPPAVFKNTGTGVDTSVLFFRKNSSSITKCKMYMVDSVGYETKTKFQRTVAENCLKDILKDEKKPLEISQLKLTDRMDAKYFINQQNNINLPINMSDYYEVITTTKKDLIRHLDNNDVIKYVQYSDIDNTFGFIKSHTEYTDKDYLPSRACQIVCAGDVIVPRLGASTDSAAIVTQEYNNTIVSSGFIILRPKIGYTTEFIFTLFKSKLVKKQMECLSTGSIMAAVADNYFSELRFYDLTPEEILNKELAVKNAFVHIEKAKNLIEGKCLP